MRQWIGSTSSATRLGLRIAGLLTILLGGITCGGGGDDGGPSGPDPTVVASVVVTPDSVQIGSVGSQTTLHAVARNASLGEIAGAAIAWQALDPTIATVANGTVTAVANGRARIVASSGGFADTGVVRVAQIVRTITITPTSDTINVGETVTPTVVAKDSGNTVIASPTLTWTSAPTGIVSISSTGAITGSAIGTTVVTATAAGGATGTTTIRVQSAVAPNATRSWTGASSTNWSDGANWAPTGVPTATDTVVVPSGSPRYPTLTADASVAGIVVPAGATVATGTFTLTVTIDAFVPGGITGGGVVRMSGTGRISGTFPSLDVTGSPRLIDSTRVIGAVTVATSGDLNVNLLALVVSGSVTTTGGGKISTGAAGTHRFTLNGSSAQTIALASPALSQLGSIEIANASGVVFATDATVGDVLITTGVASGSGRVTITTGGITDAVGNRWTVANTTFNGTSPALPATVTSHLTFAGPAGSLITRDIAVTGSITVTGTIDLNGKIVTVSDTFATVGASAHLKSSNAASVLQVTKNAAFRGGDATGDVSAGEFRFRGRLDQFNTNSSLSLVFGGTHKTTIDGTLAQVVAFASGGPAASRMKLVSVSNTSGVSFPSDVAVDSSLVLSGTAGNITGAGTVTLARALVDAVDNRFRAAGLVLTDTAPDLPNTVTTNVTFGSTATPARSLKLKNKFTVNGDVTVADDTLALNGFKLLASKFQVNGSAARVRMTSTADTIDASGDVTIAGAATTGLLTSGTIIARANVSIASAVSSSAYAPSGTHRLIMKSAGGTKTVSIEGASFSGNRLRQLIVENAAGGITRVVNVSGAAAVVDSQVVVRSGTVDGPSAAIDVRGSVIDSTGTGTTVWSVDSTVISLNSVAPVAAAVVTLPAAMKTRLALTGWIKLNGAFSDTGNVSVSGSTGRVSLNAKTLNVVVGGTGGGHFATASGGKVEMTASADVLSIGGNATFGGGSTDTLLTNGVITLAGNFSQVGSASKAFRARGSHVMRFVGSGNQTVSIAAPPAASTDTSAATSNSFFMHMELRKTGNGAVTFSSNNTYLHGSFDAVGTGASGNGFRVLTGLAFRVRGTFVLNSPSGTFTNDGTATTCSTFSAVGWTIVGSTPTEAVCSW